MAELLVYYVVTMAELLVYYVVTMAELLVYYASDNGCTCWSKYAPTAL